MSTHFLSNFKCRLVLLIGFITSSLITYGQNRLDLNADQQSMRKGTSLTQLPTDIKEHSIAVREFEINPLLQKGVGVQKGDQITLSLFEKKNYEAVIDRVERDVNESVVISAKLPDYPMGYVIISTSALGKSLVTVEIPELEEHYKTIADVSKEETYLVQFLSSEHDHSKCGGAVDSEEINEVELEGKGQYRVAESLSTCESPIFGEDMSDNATIRILVVYTAEAAAWSAANHGGIGNTISSGISVIQNTWNNSQIGATVELAYSVQVDYVDTDDINLDLSRLQGSHDGFLDNISELRKAYSADLVSLIVRPNRGNAAGIAYLLSQKTGRYDYGYSVILANYFNSFTTPHEIGHNMGMNHDVANANSASAITPYSFGWRWNGTNSVQYRSIMAYDPGIRVDNFSDSSQSYQGTATGTEGAADNARLAREIKHVIAGYKDKVAQMPTEVSNLWVNSTHDYGASISWNAVEGAVGYKVSYFHEGSWWSFGQITQTTYTLENYLGHLQPGTTYRWRVDAVGSCSGATSRSREAIFTTTGGSLPVTLVGFEAQVQEYAINLSWETSNELNSSHFVVERSVNGHEWTALGHVEATGTTDQSRDYNFTDVTPSDKQNYYRLKTVDIDQSFEYSKIITVAMDERILLIYPNPVIIEFEIKGLLVDAVDFIQLVNGSGQVVLHKTNLESNRFNVQSLPGGVYILQVKYQNGELVTRRVLVNK